MHHRSRPHSTWMVAIAFAMVAALFAAIGSSPAAAQTGPSIADPGAQSHDIGHRACTLLRASGPVDDWEVENFDLLPPGVGVQPEFGVPDAGRILGIPERAGNYTFRVRAVSDDLGAGPWLTVRYNVFAPDPSVPVIKAGRFHRGFTIDCFSAGWVANDFLSNPANFGPNGRVRLPSGLSIHEQTSESLDRSRLITPAYLADADILFDGFVGAFEQREYTNRELRLIENWVEGGGVLIAAEDDENSDGLGELFGVPTAGHEIPPRGSGDFHCGLPDEPACPQFSPAGAAGDHPIVRGPFGTWSRIDTDGTVGHLARRTPSGWTRVANHPNGAATIIERKVGNGHVIIITDEGTVRTNLDGQNSTYLGNLFAFAISQVTAVPVANNDVFSGTVFRRFQANICRNDDKGDGANRVRITGGSLPPDLRLNRRTCVISGTPRLGSFGTFGATYQIRDADGDTSTGRIQITFNSSFDGSGAEGNPRCRGERATIVGTPGDDVIRGTRGVDVIVAGNGNDVIRGLRGNDIICAGRGRDTIVGGPGRDFCDGGPGRDRIRGCEARRR